MAVQLMRTIDQGHFSSQYFDNKHLSIQHQNKHKEYLFRQYILGFHDPWWICTVFLLHELDFAKNIKL